ncbi:hypothetical protein APE02nite_13570 [Alkalibacterium pelagium]|nr:hypothetical protein APE02nite_13570 [Alkalibacterium pelagium]
MAMRNGTVKSNAKNRSTDKPGDWTCTHLVKVIHFNMTNQGNHSGFPFFISRITGDTVSQNKGADRGY